MIWCTRLIVVIICFDVVDLWHHLSVSQVTLCIWCCKKGYQTDSANNLVITYCLSLWDYNSLRISLSLISSFLTVGVSFSLSQNPSRSLFLSHTLSLWVSLIILHSYSLSLSLTHTHTQFLSLFLYLSFLTHSRSLSPYLCLSHSLYFLSVLTIL